MKFSNLILSTSLIAGLTLGSAQALANTESYTCVKGDDKRVISVVYSTPGQTLPCEVFYEKADGGNSLWRASNQEGYCEEKAAQFAEKQTTWGYTCEKGIPEQMTP